MKKKYYIYHIPGIKIGCTMYPKHRIVRAQKYTNYEILEIHTDIKIAADREIELQKEYGYKVDTHRYDSNFTSKQLSKGGINANKNKKEYFGGKRGCGNRDNMLKTAQIGRKIMQQKHGVKINAFDFKTKKFINSFPSITQATKELKCSFQGIKNVLEGKQLKHKSFFFSKNIFGN